MTETTEPVCTCGAQPGIPHDEACPVTAFAREAFRLSGEFAQGGFIDNVSPTGRVRPVVIVGAGMGLETARMLRTAMSERGFDVMIDIDGTRAARDIDFSILEDRIVKLHTLKARDTARGETFKTLYGIRPLAVPAIEDFEDTGRAARRARARTNKRKAQKRARTGRTK